MGMVCLGKDIRKEGCEVGGDNVNRRDGDLETLVFKEKTHTQPPLEALPTMKSSKIPPPGLEPGSLG